MTEVFDFALARAPLRTAHLHRASRKSDFSHPGQLRISPEPCSLIKNKYLLSALTGKLYSRLLICQKNILAFQLKMEPPQSESGAQGGAASVRYFFFFFAWSGGTKGPSQIFTLLSI